MQSIKHIGHVLNLICNEHNYMFSNLKTLRQIVTSFNPKVQGFPQHFRIEHYPQIPLLHP